MCVCVCGVCGRGGSSLTIGIISSKQSHRTGVRMRSGSKDYFRHFLQYSSVFDEDWSVRVKAASYPFNLTNNKFTELVRERLWGNVYGKHRIR